jgi:hypothetical protein
MPHQPTDASGSGNPEVTSHEVAETPEEILEYWTPERMAKAEPAGRTLELPDSADRPAQDQTQDQTQDQAPEEDRTEP